MLSNWPTCFNLIGMLRSTPAGPLRLVDPSWCRSVPLEVVVREAKAVDALRSWAIELGHRYLDMSAVR
jgi:hypothetical protein